MTTLQRISFLLMFWAMSGRNATSSDTATIPGCDSYLDLLLIIDSSESVLDDDPVGSEGVAWTSIKNFTSAVVRGLPVGTNTSVAAIRFGSRAEVVFDLQQHSSGSAVRDALMSMEHVGGNTNTAEAIRKARIQIFNGKNTARSGARNIVVFIGDGISNREVHKTDEEIRLLKATQGSGAEVFSVGISNKILDTELRKIASLPAETHFMQAPRLEDLVWIKDLLLHRICRLPDPPVPSKHPACRLPGCRICDDTECLVCLDGTYLTQGRCKDCISNCQVCSDAVHCQQCNRGWYWEPETARCEECQLIADLALVIDNSGSIRDKNPKDKSYDNYLLLKEFVNTLLDRVDIGPNATRVGAIKFSSMSQLVFSLETYTQRDMIKQAILNMGYSGGHTNISGGLRMMREQLFTQTAGDRADIGNIALVITDGESTIDQNLTDTEADLAKQDGITLFVIGVTDEINEDELKSMASPPTEEHYFNSTDIKTLNNLLHSLTTQVCAQKPTTST